MDNEHTLEIIKALLVGKNPFTGEIYEGEHILKNPKVTSALFSAFVAIRKNISREQLPANAGKSWGYDEELQLISEFKAGATLIEIANTHQRTVGAISSRLVKLFGEDILTQSINEPIVESDDDGSSISDIYHAISDGSGEPAYLGDGVWIEADGSVHDRGR